MAEALRCVGKGHTWRSHSPSSSHENLYAQTAPTGQAPCHLFAWGGWFGSVRCSAFELSDGRSCDMGPPSSAKILVENLRACPVGAVCASVSAEWARLVLARGCKSFYSGCYRLSVPKIFTASIAYHAVIILHTVRGPCNETRVLSAAAVVCRPYLCHVDRTIADSSMPVSGWLRCVRLITLEV
ncbi:hypothetical protein GW17_00018269 [Ensete ventricosum]|nr:hypothetical protein GW17_00018269 [Ensete ventricosum]